MYDNASKLYNLCLGIYFDQYNSLSDAQKKELDNMHDPINLFFQTCNYDIWFENEKLADTSSRKNDKKGSADLSDITLL